MDDHVSRILKMLEEGKVSAAEAERLIAALRTEARGGAAQGGSAGSSGASSSGGAAGSTTEEGSAEADGSAKSFEFRWSRKSNMPFDLSQLSKQITEAMRRIDPERLAREARAGVERETRRLRDRMKSWGQALDSDGRPANELDEPTARASEAIDHALAAGGTVIVENMWGDVAVAAGGDRVTVAFDKEAWAATEQTAEAALRDLKLEVSAHQITEGVPGRLELRVTAPADFRTGTTALKVTVPAGTSIEAATSFGEARVGGVAAPVTVRSVSGAVVLSDLASTPAALLMPTPVRAETISGAIRAERVDLPVNLTSKSGDVEVEGITSGGELVSVSGDVRARHIDGARLEVKSVSGDVSLEDAGAREPMELTIESVSGDVNVSRARGVVALKTVSGDIQTSRLEVTTLQGQTVSGDARIGLDGAFGGTLSCNSVSGDVVIDLPATSSFRYTLGTQSGALSCSLPTHDDDRTDTLWTGIVGEGAGTVSVHTRSGDARLARAEQG